MIWKPHVTVAAVIRKDHRYLMVEEITDGKTVINQPAGHLDPGESLVEAVRRETLEETAWNFEPRAICGIYQWTHPLKKITFLRVAFCGDLLDHDPSLELDDGIIRALWLSRDQLLAKSAQLRSPMVMRCIDDFNGGNRYPLDLLTQLKAEPQSRTEAS